MRAAGAVLRGIARQVLTAMAAIEHRSLPPTLTLPRKGGRNQPPLALKGGGKPAKLSRLFLRFSLVVGTLRVP
jgi:hypothetical protein